MNKVNTVRASTYIEDSILQRDSVIRAGNATVTSKEPDRVMSYRNIWSNGYSGDNASTLSGTRVASLH
jgi:hypothetical protein